MIQTNAKGGSVGWNEGERLPAADGDPGGRRAAVRLRALLRREGRIWNVAQHDGASARAVVEDEAGHCPGGRLVAWDRNTRRALEPELPPSLGLIEDRAQGISGPIWVRVGIPIVAADGTEYEVRNRVALCRCGASSNKAFCDGSHASIKFRDDR